MFGAIMENVLMKHLGKYVQGIKNNIDVSIINGDVSLENISIKPQIINELGLPILLKFSHISKILVKVPWTSLKDKPTIVSVQGIYALFTLDYDGIDQQYYDSRERILDIVNRVKTQLKKKMEDRAGKEETFAEKSLIRIIDNLKLQIDDVHIRVQSIKRGCDFSLGVLMNSISSYTVDQYGQKAHYTRHFTHKEDNKPLHKIFYCNQFKLYFNEKEKYFFAWHLDRSKEHMLGLFSQPFKGKKPKSMQSLSAINVSYPLHSISDFSFDMVLEQYFSKDKKYVVEIKPQFPKLSLELSSTELSQLLIIGELFYEWGIGTLKRGKKEHGFNAQIESYFRAVIYKMSKEEKISEKQMNNLEEIVLKVPLMILEQAADRLIKEHRMTKEMKKINKINNKDKSKKLMERMFEKIENEDIDIFEMFEHITIQFNVPELKLITTKNEEALIEWGWISILGKLKLVLAKNLFFDLQVAEFFLREWVPQRSQMISLVSDKKLMQQPFLEICLSQTHGMSPIIKAIMKKRWITLYQSTALAFFIWIEEIRIKPPLANWLQEQLQYSVHITQQIFSVLFSHHEYSLNLSLSLPLFSIITQQQLLLDFGTIEVHRTEKNIYKMSVSEEQSISIDGVQIVKCERGNMMSLTKKKPETVEVDIKKMEIKNIEKVVEYVGETMKSEMVNKWTHLELVKSEEIKLQGEFLLNQYTEPQEIIIKGNSLILSPLRAEVPLLHTHVYPYRRHSRQGLIFHQYIKKKLNVIYMNSQKLMNTLLVRLRQHIVHINTFTHFTKYASKEEVIESVNQLHQLHTNKELIALIVRAKEIDMEVKVREVKQCAKIRIWETEASIIYKEYNTGAKITMMEGQLTLDTIKVVEQGRARVEYEHLTQRKVEMELDKLQVDVPNWNIVQAMTKIGTQLALHIHSVIQIASQWSKPSPKLTQLQPSYEDMQYLLQSRVFLKWSPITANIIGYNTQINYFEMQALQYKGIEQPTVQLVGKGISLLSIVNLQLLKVHTNQKRICVVGEKATFSLNMELVLYELREGVGLKLKESFGNVMGVHRQMENNPINRPLSLTLTDVEARLRLFDDVEIIVGCEQVVYDQAVRWKSLWVSLLEDRLLDDSSGQVVIKYTPSTCVCIELSPIHFSLSLTKVLTLYQQLSFIRKKLLSFPIFAAASLPSTHTCFQCIAPEVVFTIFSFSDRLLGRVTVQNINIIPDNPTAITLAIQHLNNRLKIFEPLLEPTTLHITTAEQIQIEIENIMVIVSSEMVEDVMMEYLHSKQAMRRCEEKLQQPTHSAQEIEKYKKLIQGPQRLNSIHEPNHTASNSIQMTNYLPTELLIQLRIEEGKHVFCLKPQQSHELSFPVKQSFHHSYQLVEKYRKVKAKMSFLHSLYYTNTQHFVFSFAERKSFFHPCLFCDDCGREVNGGIGVSVGQYTHASYAVEVISCYQFVSQLEDCVVLQWAQAIDMKREKVTKGKLINIPPWVHDGIMVWIEGYEHSHHTIHFPNFIQTETFQVLLQTHQQYDTVMKLVVMRERQAHLQEQLQPSLFRIRPAIQIHNHFHNPIIINSEVFKYNEVKHLKMIHKEGKREFVSVRLGDGSMHELYLPEVEEVGQFQLKLMGENYIEMMIKRINLQSGEYVFHIYGKLQVSLNFPKPIQPELQTEIYNQWFRVKKQWIREDKQCDEFSIPLLKDKFYLHTHRYVLGQHEKYLTISNAHVRSNKIILYPSLYEEDLCFYSVEEQEHRKPLFMYSINYDTAVIDEGVVMHYVMIVPKCYLANRTKRGFLVQGKTLLKHGERMVLHHNAELEIELQSQQPSTLINPPALCLTKHKQLIFYSKVTFHDHEHLQHLHEVQKHPEENSEQREHPIVLDTHNMSIIDVRLQRYCQNMVVYVLEECPLWLHIDNELGYRMQVRSNDGKVQYVSEVDKYGKGTHPFGIDGIEEVQLYIDVGGQWMQLGTFDLAVRLQYEVMMGCIDEEVVIREFKTNLGRKMSVHLLKDLPSNRQVLLKVSRSVCLTVDTIGISIVMWPDSQRRQLCKIVSQNLRLLTLQYPSGLYMLDFKANAHIRSHWLVAELLSIPEVQVYIEGVEGEFIERLTIKLKQTLRFFITDEFLFLGLEQANKIKETVKQRAEANDIPFSSGQAVQNGPTVTILNSLVVSPISISITIRKLLTPSNPRKKHLLADIGFSIAEIDNSLIQLSKVEIEELVTDYHLEKVTKMYIKEVVVGCLGGMNMIGNPKQFVEELQAGRSRGWPVLGTIRGVIAGSANSVGKILMTLGNGISELSFDEEYQRERNENASLQPVGFFNGVKLGAVSFAGSLKSGITGVVEKPYEGAKKQGGVGFLQGSLYGLTGLVVKPVTGIIDLTSMTIQGIKSTSSYRTQAELNQYFLHLQRPLYHKFALLRHSRRQDQITHHILQNRLKTKVQLVQSYILEDEMGKQINQAVAITCTKLYLIDLQEEETISMVENERMIATGKFLEGVVLYYDDGYGEQEELVFRLRREEKEKDSLYWTLKAFINLYAQSGEANTILQA